MNFILFDEEQIIKQLLPLSYTRSIADFRVGIRTIREKWEAALHSSVYIKTQDYLQPLYEAASGDAAASGSPQEDTIFINSSILPSANLVQAILALEPKQKLVKEEICIAYRGEKLGETPSGQLRGDLNENQTASALGSAHAQNYNAPLVQIQNTWEIFVFNREAILSDFEQICNGRKSGELSDTNTIIGDRNLIFVEEGASVEASILNTKDGPIYIGKDADIQEGSMLRGPIAICEHSTVRMGAKIYGDTTIGPHCKVAGEISNSVIFGYSNKAHDGYLGNSVLGHWCNLGANTTNSNLKNDYSPVKLWSYAKEGFVNTNLQFCGLIMGDHSKTAIGTIFNTGTVVGVSCNVYGAGFHRQFIPSFMWGSNIYPLNKAVETAKRVYKRRNIEFKDIDESVMRYIYESTHNREEKI